MFKIRRKNKTSVNKDIIDIEKGETYCFRVKINENEFVFHAKLNKLKLNIDDGWEETVPFHEDAPLKIHPPICTAHMDMNLVPVNNIICSKVYRPK